METNKKIRVCNLFAGVGGNRKLWENVDVTAVESDENIAAIYQDFFPQDKMIVGDAHEYLLQHFNEYDFIWSSPPCPSHSHVRKITSHQNTPLYPDMQLYQEVLLLQGYSKAKFVVENVISWYVPLVPPQTIGKHYFWANFMIAPFFEQVRNHKASIATLTEYKGFNLNKYKGIDARKALRNCVVPELGKHIFDCAFNGKAQTLFESQEMIQDNLFAEV